MVESLVEGVGHFGGVAHQQRVPARIGVNLVGVQGVGGHGDGVSAVKPVVGAVPVDGLSDLLGFAVAQREAGGAFFRVGHAPDLGEVLCPGQIGAQLGEHAAAGLDRGELVGIPDQHRLGAGRGGGGEELTQVVGADHGGLIHDDQGLWV